MKFLSPIRTKDWTYAHHAVGDWVLYNTREDPYQLANLVADPQYRARRDELHAMLDEKRKELKDDALLEMDADKFSLQTGIATTRRAPGKPTR